ncbi:MAG: helix-turn-helix domain-containing protein [Bacteroidales bacterium]|nr:helix-turn-helix domain-containing protein [Bacteroidales bacterium]
MTREKKLKADQPFVNQKLQFVEDLVLHTDAHIFLTGKAGTGKTTFLKSLPAKTHKRMVVVAPTGVAAINAGGQTIHSFFQLPFGPQLPDGANLATERRMETPSLQFQRITRTKLKIMRTLDLLIIDEISMVRADVLDAVDAVLRRARHSTKPFGGVQLLMIGDVHQLAPVAKPEEWELLAPYYKTVYFFGSHVLQKTDYLCVELDHIYRQHDNEFITLLNKVRDNQLDNECLQILNSRYIPELKPSEGYITLTTHNYQADDINNTRLSELNGKSLIFNAMIEGVFPQSLYPCKEDLELKIGAQVMFVKNDPNPEKAYYNGKIGKLTDYNENTGELTVTCGNEHIPVTPVRWQNLDYTLNESTQAIEEKEIGSFTQIPLRLAWAVTIHKSQGLTFDKLVVDARQAFAHGQVYVALSRCTSLEGLVLKTKLDAKTLVGDGIVDYFVEQMPEKEPSKEKVDTLRKAYELETILDLFDFRDFYRLVGKIAKVVIDNRTLFEGELVQELSTIRDKSKTKLVDVSQKFEKQIRTLHSSALYESNPPLQERLQKGTTYFKEELTTQSDMMLKLPYKTDNKNVNEQIEDALKQLREVVYVKKQCLSNCEQKFDVDRYYKTKAVSLLEFEQRDKSAFSIKDAAMNKSKLYDVLVAWRSEKAEEEDAELYKIIPNKTLKAIAKEKPVSMDALKEIEGMGPKRLRTFGKDLVNMVRIYSGMESLEDTSPEIEIPERITKKPKGTTFRITKQLIDQGMTVEEIASERNLTLSTIYGHIARFVEAGDYEAFQFVAKEKITVIEEYFRDTEDPSLGKAKEVLGDDYEFWELRIVQAEMNRKQK